MSLNSFEGTLELDKVSKLEENLQKIVNDLTMIMESLKFKTI